jgi:hypothetical protein
LSYTKLADILFVIEMKGVYCAVRSESFNQIFLLVLIGLVTLELRASVTTYMVK